MNLYPSASRPVGSFRIGDRRHVVFEVDSEGRDAYEGVDRNGAENLPARDARLSRSSRANKGGANHETDDLCSIKEI